MWHQKTSFTHSLKRRRKNSKYQRCRESLLRDERAATEAAQLTLLATRQGRLWALKPFSEDFSKGNFEEFAAQAESRYEEDLDSDVRRLKTEQSEYRPTRKENPFLCSTNVKHSLDKIINGDFEVGLISQSHDIQSIKTSYQAAADEHLTQVKKAKKDQLGIKKRISQRFMERYPERKYHQSEDFTEMFSRDTQTTFTQSAKTPQKNDNFARSTYFYSRSRKKCFMERYFPEQRVPSEKSIEPAISFLQYLADDKVKKSLQKRDKKQRCLNLMRRKDNILKIQKPGTRKHQRLKKCLDEIIMENILR